MTEIRSEQAACVLVTGDGALQTIAECPADRRWIVRDMRIREALTDPDNAVVIAVAKPGGDFVPLYDTVTEAHRTHWEGWSVMLPGDLLRVYAAVGDYVRVLASVTELPL